MSDAIALALMALWIIGTIALFANGYWGWGAASLIIMCMSGRRT